MTSRRSLEERSGGIAYKIKEMTQPLLTGPGKTLHSAFVTYIVHYGTHMVLHSIITQLVAVLMPSHFPLQATLEL